MRGCSEAPSLSGPTHGSCPTAAVLGLCSLPTRRALCFERSTDPHRSNARHLALRVARAHARGRAWWRIAASPQGSQQSKTNKERAHHGDSATRANARSRYFNGAEAPLVRLWATQQDARAPPFNPRARTPSDDAAPPTCLIARTQCFFLQWISPSTGAGC